MCSLDQAVQALLSMWFVGVCVCPDVLKEVRQGQHDLGEVESKYAKGQVVCEAELWEMSEEGLSVEKQD